MDAHGGLLYMVAYNLRKVENRDRYPDPPLNCRYSIGAVPRLVAPVAPVRFRVAATTVLDFFAPQRQPCPDGRQCMLERHRLDGRAVQGASLRH